MTVSTTENSVSYVGDGATTTFAFTFYVDATTDIQVFIDDVEQVAGFVVTLNADQSANPGGSVEITPAPAVSAVVDIIRNTEQTQETDYNAYDPFPAETHERQLDRNVLMIQDVQAQVDTLNTNKLEWVTAPTTTSDTGVAGQVAYDTDYLYVCTATDTWKRTLLETW